MDNRAVITDHRQGQNYRPGDSFREVSLIMAAPWTDEEIEQLFQQEPLNNVAQLPAEEPTEEIKCQ